MLVAPLTGGIRPSKNFSGGTSGQNVVPKAHLPFKKMEQKRPDLSVTNKLCVKENKAIAKVSVVR